MNTFEELVAECRLKNKKIYELFQEDEAFIGECSVRDVRSRVSGIIDAMDCAIRKGLASSELSASGLCGDDCQKLQTKFSKNGALFGELYEKITTYALATIEENSRMGKIVACPTAGSCAIVPSVLIAASEFLGLSREVQIDGLITAGEIGAIISHKLSLAGAVAGCQAECGVASAMSAAALTQMRGGSIDEILNSVALALKNILGLTCDPVCGLVEVPCVKRNPFLAIHAVTACELAMAGIESKIPLDEVVDALLQTGQLMSPLLKESSKGGLATTKFAADLAKKLSAK